MTREEAITNLKMIRVAFVEPVTEEQAKLIDDTFDMAIKALEQEPCDYYDADNQTCRRSEVPKEPCEDAISRQAVLDKIRAEIDDVKMPKNRMSFFRDGIECALEIIDKCRAEGGESVWVKQT